MKSYYEQIASAQRWQKTIDYGSVVSAWSPVMFKIKKQAENELQAIKLLAEFKKMNNCADKANCTICGACYKH